MNQVTVALEEVVNDCFVVMPFHALFEAQYRSVYKPAIEDAGLTCVRGDEIYSKPEILQDIWRAIRRARVVVAELSGKNPNVMYEVGLAHAIGKPIILLTRDEKDVPFDLKSLRYLFYDVNDPFWGNSLRAKLSRMLRCVLEDPLEHAHLSGVSVDFALPATPRERSASASPPTEIDDFSGTWHTSWRSVSVGREHSAILVVPGSHGESFSALMVVQFEKNRQPTVVHETLAGTASGSTLSLTGVNYTYRERGASRNYSLDSFEVTKSSDGKTLVGQAVLRNGRREVLFVKQPESRDKSNRPANNGVQRTRCARR